MIGLEPSLGDLLRTMSSFIAPMPEPCIFIGIDFRILAVNRAYRVRFGDPPEGDQFRCHQAFHRSCVSCDQMGQSCPLATSRESGEPSRMLHIHLTPQGLEHVDVEVTPIRAGNDHILFFAATLRTVRRVGSRPSQCLVGVSPAFSNMLALLERVAPSDTTVLLTGESGTGKELIAQAIHEASPRSRRPFVAVDCASMTEALFGSELFGHERGAFTGANERKIGLVEAVAGGTLFFDEIGDMPLCLQVKLLRLLESGTFRRVGGVDSIRADCRLVLATNRNIEAMVADGSFRGDLYFRISAFPIHAPPLREREGDLPVLIESLLEKLTSRPLRLHPDTMARLAGYKFPGNVRELRNILERASLLADGDVILPEHLPEKVSEPVAVSAGYAGILPLADAERRYLRWARSQRGEDRRSLATKLGISERTLYRKLKEAGID